MDNAVLRKRLNTFKSAKGTLRKVSDEVVMEVLRAWESWPGTSKDFYREIAVSKQQLAILIKKAKNLVKSGAILEEEFKEIMIEESKIAAPCSGMELIWGEGKVIRFLEVDLLVDFLKKVA